MEHRAGATNESRLRHHKRIDRAIAFIDPFGMQFDWQTMENLAGTKTVEIVLNVPVMAINRSVLRKDPKMISEATKIRLNHFWGTAEWMVDLYEEEQTLLVQRKSKDGCRVRNLAAFSRSGLRKYSRIVQIPF